MLYEKVKNHYILDKLINQLLLLHIWRLIRHFLVDKVYFVLNFDQLLDVEQFDLRNLLIELYIQLITKLLIRLKFYFSSFSPLYIFKLLRANSSLFSIF